MCPFELCWYSKHDWIDCESDVIVPSFLRREKNYGLNFIFSVTEYTRFFPDTHTQGINEGLDHNNLKSTNLRPKGKIIFLLLLWAPSGVNLNVCKESSRHTWVTISIKRVLKWCVKVNIIFSVLHMFAVLPAHLSGKHHFKRKKWILSRAEHLSLQAQSYMSWKLTLVSLISPFPFQ